MLSILHFARIGSGTVIVLGALIFLIILLCGEQLVGWDPTWRAFGVTPLQPHFFDMHVPLDYATCAAMGFDPYIPHSCNVANFNIPPVWLWLSVLGLTSSDAAWLSIAITAAALAVMVILFKNRSVTDGIIALIAILSPSVLMGVERGNPDLLILAIVGAAALVYADKILGRSSGAVALIALGIILKLFPTFCVALAARFNRRTLLFALVITLVSLVYFVEIFKYILFIRANVPTTFILSYGYKAIFLGLDHLRSEAGLNPFGLADTWAPVIASSLTLIGAGAVAWISYRRDRMFCPVADSTAGTAFLFGGGIYCGTFLLGTNFIYRLMFLLLCVPQLQDWIDGQPRKQALAIARALLVTILAVLWLNGNANGHTTFLWAPQLFNWLLFFALATALFANFPRSAFAPNVMVLGTAQSVSRAGTISSADYEVHS